jgi:hypothetical protein
MEDFPDTPLGRATRWLDVVTGEHAHQESLELADMRENTDVLERLFAGTVVDATDAYAIGGLPAANTLEVVMNAGMLDTNMLREMFRGLFLMGVCAGARAQAGLHNEIKSEGS